MKFEEGIELLKKEFEEKIEPVDLSKNSSKINEIEKTTIHDQFYYGELKSAIWI